MYHLKANEIERGKKNYRTHIYTHTHIYVHAKERMVGARLSVVVAAFDRLFRVELSHSDRARVPPLGLEGRRFPPSLFPRESFRHRDERLSRSTIELKRRGRRGFIRRLETHGHARADERMERRKKRRILLLEGRESEEEEEGTKGNARATVFADLAPF